MQGGPGGAGKAWEGTTAGLKLRFRAPVCTDPPQEPGRFLATPTQEEMPCLVQAAYVSKAELKMEYHKRIPKAQQARGGPRPALPPPISPAYRSVITQSLSHSVALSIPL